MPGEMRLTPDWLVVSHHGQIGIIPGPESGFVVLFEKPITSGQAGRALFNQVLLCYSRSPSPAARRGAAADAAQARNAKIRAD